MFTKTRLFAVSATCAAALVLSACGGGGGGSDSSDGGAPSGDPVAGGTLRALQLAEPPNLDPAVLTNNDHSSGLLGNALFGTLLTRDEKTGAVAQSMAESFETADGGKTFTLVLRDGLEFSDGTPLDAEAVKFNWERLKDPALASASRFDASLITSATVVDARTLEIALAQPSPMYGAQLAQTSMNWIASPAALQKGKQGFDAEPVGAGPFTLKNWSRGGTLSVVKNAAYWDAPRPYLDGITFSFAADEDQRVSSIMSGGADLSPAISWGAVAKAKSANLQVQSMPIAGGQVFVLNTKRAPFDDVRARQALSHALDIGALDDAINQGEGLAATTLFPKGSPFYNDTALQTFDKAKAQELFDELAAEGKPVSFTFTSFPGNESTAEAVQAQLGAYKNVTVKVGQREWAETGAVFGQGDFDVTIAAVNFIDPEPDLFSFFFSKALRNPSKIADPELDAALLSGRTEQSTEARKAAYDTVAERLAELVPAIFYQRSSFTTVATTKVGGITMYGAGSLIPDELWLTK